MIPYSITPVCAISDVATEHPESSARYAYYLKKSSGTAQQVEFLIN